MASSEHQTTRREFVCRSALLTAALELGVDGGAVPQDALAQSFPRFPGRLGIDCCGCPYHSIWDNGTLMILNICSVHAKATIEGFTCYAASKAGILALTRALAIECAPQGVRLNAISPGTIDTPMLQAFFDTCPDRAIWNAPGCRGNGRIPRERSSGVRHRHRGNN
jgi:NAD(P)-dependent dehydrogenase (short-subunit alcohol dehydrogenase family)